jgi:hypothetical protein
MNLIGIVQICVVQKTQVREMLESTSWYHPLSFTLKLYYYAEEPFGSQALQRYGNQKHEECSIPLIETTTIFYVTKPVILWGLNNSQQSD